MILRTIFKIVKYQTKVFGHRNSTVKIKKYLVFWNKIQKKVFEKYLKQ